MRVTRPLTASRDEWAAAFGELAKLIVEGFETTIVRRRLKEMGVAFENNRGNLKLIEKDLASVRGGANENKLQGLKAVQLIRSKALAHVRGTRATELATDALQEYGSYTAHFESVCQFVFRELELIENAFSCDSFYVTQNS